MGTAASAAPAGFHPDKSVGRFWWAPVLAGVLSLVIGIASLAYPGPTLLVVGILFGGYLAVWGVVRIVDGVTADGMGVMLRVLFVIIGLLGALTGLILLVRPGQSLLTFVWVLGFWWAISGIMQLAAGLAEHEGRWWNVFMGILGVVAGVIILAQPGIGLVTLVWIVGITLIVQGFAEIASGFAIRRLHKEGVV